MVSGGTRRRSIGVASAWNVGRTWLESRGAFRGRGSSADMLLRPLFGRATVRAIVPVVDSGVVGRCYEASYLSERRGVVGLGGVHIPSRLPRIQLGRAF